MMEVEFGSLNNDNQHNNAQRRHSDNGRRSYRRSSSFTTISGHGEMMEVEFGRAFQPMSTRSEGEEGSVVSDMSGLSMSTISGLFSRHSRGSLENNNRRQRASFSLGSVVSKMSRKSQQR